jgi:hypothetical protein
MHNVHTPAPYGYGWTTISIIPYFFGFGKFLITWLNFKLFALLSFFLTSCFLFTILKKAHDRNSRLLLFTLNPLILIEVLGNGHNDLWMMVPALISYIFLEKYTNEKIKYQKNIFLAGCLIAILLSIFIKYSTLIILPLIVVMLVPSVIKNLQKHKYYLWLKKHFAEVAAILLFLPLLSDRSQQFHPWYLLWSLAWLPIINNRIIRIVLLSFSLSSILRYIPWIESGFQYNLEIVHNQKLITWVGGVLIFVILKFTSSNYANLALKKILK